MNGTCQHLVQWDFLVVRFAFFFVIALFYSADGVTVLFSLLRSNSFQVSLKCPELTRNWH